MRLLLLLSGLPLLAQSPEQKAVLYLAQEVPRWKNENQCYSCHNNGDGARALLIARASGLNVPAAATADTETWLSAPGKWDTNRGDPAVSDKKLARLQFAVALSERPGSDLSAVADLLSKEQAPDGSWPADTEVAVGSPVTYGTALATYLSQQVFQRAGHAAAAGKARRWFESFQPASNLDCAAALLAAKRQPCVEQLLRAQNPDGGWGPFRGTSSEVFDTALAIIALKSSSTEAVAKGRAYLMRSQAESGGWPETTRPSGSQSYAQHISTSSWALIALIETRR